MAEHYTVRQGDSIGSIALRNGLLPDTLWNHPLNAELKSRRGDPNVLCPGDELFIPDREPRVSSHATDGRHRFVRKGTPARLRLRLLKDDTPRANEPYVLTVDGTVIRGTTDASGMLETYIAPDAAEARLILQGGREEHLLALGNVDPTGTTSGLQARLSNLGLLWGPITGEMDSATRDALRRFQKAHQLPETGEADEATLGRLKSLHGC